MLPQYDVEASSDESEDAWVFEEHPRNVPDKLPSFRDVYHWTFNRECSLWCDPPWTQLKCPAERDIVQTLQAPYYNPYSDDPYMY